MLFHPVSCPGLVRFILAIVIAASAVVSLPGLANAQSYEREFSVGSKPSLTIKNRNGRVSVVTSDDQKDKALVQATSPVAPVEPSDISISGGEIVVRERRAGDRIDLIVRVPSRTRVKVESENGMVDVIGDLAMAEVLTDTGTIHADVPLDDVKFKFLWQASRPRFLSDVELPRVKEGRAGSFSISGTLGPNAKKSKDKKKKDAEKTESATVDSSADSNDANSSAIDGAMDKDEKSKADADKSKSDKDKLVQLNLTTQRGVILLNVDPAMAPNDLRERPLTEAAKGIVRSGNVPLIDAIRKVSPRLFGDYAHTLPPPDRGPSLVNMQPPGQLATAVAPQLIKVNASVTDGNGRAIPNMRLSDFAVYEDGTERKVVDVTPSTEPFNLILLLDVSGSVEERIDFIRKAARDFLRTASRQDRIAITSFRDDIQIISDFTTDRALLSKKLDDIDAGGATALYDALGYSLVDTLKPLRGERTAIVILSDGDDNKSFVPFPSILEATIESGALIYPLYVPSGLIPEASVPKPMITVDPMRTKYLTITTRAAEEGQKLADFSGGVFYSIKRLEDLQKAYDDVVAQLRTAYTITYSSEAGATHRRLRVRANREGAYVRLSPAVSSSH
ncbi:MAG TPA: VWA domain-containing protein [Pyrinomonadaceae bacterium]|jgi:VWFA-related protein|nr:VWA domain-containing protein [Pyrinomonadaceae bacterium]